MIKDAKSLLSDTFQKIEKQAATEKLREKIYNYLKSDYPETTLGWVRKNDWEEKEVKLEDIKMGRRPGGAREEEKTKAIQKLYEKKEKVDPVVLVKREGTDKYDIADGYHRTLARKKAGYDTINAYVTTTSDPSGPWIKEMHEKKISKGVKTIKETFQKQASDDWGYSYRTPLTGQGVRYLNKQANDTQGYDHRNPLTGQGVQYLNKQANPLLKMKNLTTKFKNSDPGKKIISGGKNFGEKATNVKNVALGKNKRQAKQEMLQAKKNYSNNKGNLVDRMTGKNIGNEVTKGIYDAKKQAYQKEKRRTFGTRAAIGGTAVAGMGVNNMLKNPNSESDQQNEIEKQRNALTQSMQ